MAEASPNGIIRVSLDSGVFETFAVGNGMHSEKLMADFGPDLKIFGTMSQTMGERAEKLAAD